MFEKEAEEYCTRQELLEDVRDNICNAFEDGAEFGYNKANEWHYVKDGDLPTHSYRVLVFTDGLQYHISNKVVNQNGNVCWYNYKYDKWCFENWIDEEVIWWKESE